MSDDNTPQQLVPADLDTDGDPAGADDWTGPESKPATEGPVTAEQLEAFFDVPVKVHAVLGRSRMEIRELLALNAGAVIELDRRVGEPVDLFVNNRLIARGEVVLIDNGLGVTLTEIVQQDR